MRAARVTGPLVLAIALGFAAVSESVRGMFDTFSTLFSGLGVVYVLRWIWWRINAWSEITALASGALVIVVLEFFPNTGLPLPFFSHGGSNVVTMMMALGVLMSVSRSRQQR